MLRDMAKPPDYPLTDKPHQPTVAELEAASMRKAQPPTDAPHEPVAPKHVDPKPVVVGDHVSTYPDAIDVHPATKLHHETIAAEKPAKAKRSAEFGPKPHVGALVVYTLPTHGPEARELLVANSNGAICPALVTRVLDDGKVNLRLFFDEAGTANRRVISVSQGTAPGSWAWLVEDGDAPLAPHRVVVHSPTVAVTH